MVKPMAPDERERNFDKALGRQLRSSAADATASPSPMDSAAQRESCLDPETLAAYHERSLLPEHMNSSKEHIVGCANCQSILAQLEATDSILLQTLDESQVLAANEASPVLTARSLETIPVSAAPKKSRRVLLLSGARWQWLAPAGAIAAGLLVYIALHENQPLPLPKNAAVEKASRQVPAAPAPPVSNGVPESSRSSYAVRPNPPAAADELTASKTQAASEGRKSGEKLYDRTQLTPPRPSADKESGLRKDDARARVLDSLHAENQLDRDAKSLPSTKQKNEEVQLQAQTQTLILQSQNQNQNISNAPKAAGPAPMGQAHMEAKRMKAASAAPPPAPSSPGVSGGAVTEFSDTASSKLVGALSNSHLIAPPGSAFLWRAGRAGAIDFSPDAGSSWSSQSSGVLVDLFTGSAPSDNVCWIVGRLGTVLLTTDGGAHWKLLSSPMKDDISGIQASDALHARIWNLRNTKIFETADGGLSWKSVSHP
jgi:hypothetical protein